MQLVYFYAIVNIAEFWRLLSEPDVLTHPQFE